MVMEGSLSVSFGGFMRRLENQMRDLMQISNKWRVLISHIFLAVFANVLGYLIGRSDAPQYESRIEAYQYVMSNVKCPLSNILDLIRGKLRKEQRSTLELLALKPARRSRLVDVERMMVGTNESIRSGEMTQ